MALSLISVAVEGPAIARAPSTGLVKVWRQVWREQ